MQLSKKLVTVAYNLSASPGEAPSPLPPEAKKNLLETGAPLISGSEGPKPPPPPHFPTPLSEGLERPLPADD